MSPSIHSDSIDQGSRSNSLDILTVDVEKNDSPIFLPFPWDDSSLSYYPSYPSNVEPVLRPAVYQPSQQSTGYSNSVPPREGPAYYQPSSEYLDYSNYIPPPIRPAIYQLSPQSPDIESRFNIVLHFPVYSSKKYVEALLCFSKVLPQLFPDARVLCEVNEDMSQDQKVCTSPKSAMKSLQWKDCIDGQPTIHIVSGGIEVYRPVLNAYLC